MAHFRALGFLLALASAIAGVCMLAAGDTVEAGSVMSVAESSPPLGPLMGVFIVGVAVLLGLILYLKLPAFLALITASLTIAVGGTLVYDEAKQLTELGQVLNEAMGNALGSVATIIGVGSIFGGVLQHSGGTEVLGQKLVEGFGKERAPWAMLLTGFIISIPVFLDVGLVILAPLLKELAQQTGRDILHFGLPLVIGMAVTHSFVPPTPGPTFVAAALGVPLGWVIGFGILVGFPTAVICGPLLCDRFIACLGRSEQERPSGQQDLVESAQPQPDLPSVEMVAKTPSFSVQDVDTPTRDPPSVVTVLGCVALPIVLILLATVIETRVAASLPANLGGDERKQELQKRLQNQNVLLQALHLLGSPVIALLVSTFLTMYILGTARGASKEQLLEVSNKSLEPAGSIILITGAGGMFKGVLGASGITPALKVFFSASGMNPLLLAWLMSGVIRVAQGSATVAMITAGGIMSDLLQGEDASNVSLALTACAICSGAILLSHVNDSGFWMISRYMNMTEKEALLSWTPVSGIVSVVSFGLILLLSALFD